MYNEIHNLIKENIDDNNDLYTDGTSFDDEVKFKENQYLTNLYNNCKIFKEKLNLDVSNVGNVI